LQRLSQKQAQNDLIATAPKPGRAGWRVTIRCLVLPGCQHIRTRPGWHAVQGLISKIHGH
ncbi:hypothetical protein IWW55_001883, partial [Coemansia sp. RSA 2706]